MEKVIQSDHRLCSNWQISRNALKSISRKGVPAEKILAEHRMVSYSDWKWRAKKRSLGEWNRIFSIYFRVILKPQGEGQGEFELFDIFDQCQNLWEWRTNRMFTIFFVSHYLKLYCTKITWSDLIQRQKNQHAENFYRYSCNQKIWKSFHFSSQNKKSWKIGAWLKLEMNKSQ